MAQRHDLGMGRGVVRGDGPVVARGNDLPMPHDDRAHRHLARQPGVVGLVQRDAHGVFVSGGDEGGVVGHGVWL